MNSPWLKVSCAVLGSILVVSAVSAFAASSTKNSVPAQKLAHVPTVPVPPQMPSLVAHIPTVPVPPQMPSLVAHVPTVPVPPQMPSLVAHVPTVPVPPQMPSLVTSV